MNNNFNNNFKQIITEHTYAVLEEAQSSLVRTLTNKHLVKHGVVTLEEADFYGRLATRVLTEAAEDFIPEEVDVPDDTAAAPIELYDAAGNAYVYQDGQLIPQDSGADDAPMEEGTQYQDNGQMIEENSMLNDSDATVTNIMNKLLK